MSHATSTDPEEDAADLQFPKENTQTTNKVFFNLDTIDFLNSTEIQSTCSSCFGDLVTPYIMCTECNIPICTLCFSNGVEFLNHKSDHSYQVYREDFVLFENSDWTAKEELALLDALLRYGNWNLVANALPNRSLPEIKEHYDYFYLDAKGSKYLPKFKENLAAVFPEPIVPYRFRITNLDDPPRYEPNSLGYSSLAGYNPMRSDFECEFDSSAEDMLSKLVPVDIKDPQYEILTKLQCGIIAAYNRRLKERQRWKTIMRNHGLISTRKFFRSLARYEFTITKSIYMKIIRFMQFCEPNWFEFIIEGLHRAGELKLHLSRLCNFRTKGITTLGGAQLYLKLQAKHEENKKKLKHFQKTKFVIKSNMRQFSNENSLLIPKNKKRPSFAPLEIAGLPGYEQLNDKERDLCKNVRIIPWTYFELKNLLIAENKKLGFVKLQTARRMLKIDVNKTRKLYDFLIQEGHISKP